MLHPQLPHPQLNILLQSITPKALPITPKALQGILTSLVITYYSLTGVILAKFRNALTHKPSLRPKDMRKQRRSPPARLIALSFAAAIVIGTILLWLPFSQRPDQNVSLLDALFTATSAVCVTGLEVTSTVLTFNRFGQSIILLLIKLGGLGLVTFGTLFALAFGRAIGYGARLLVAEQVSAPKLGGVLPLVRNIVLLSLAVESVGALLMYPAFQQTNPHDAAFYAMFHSVSAFNNAGFSLYPDSLVRFVGNPRISLIITLLFVAGGLGFVVVSDVWRVLLNVRLHASRWRVQQLSLHSKITLLTTVTLLIVPIPLFLLFEWHNTLAGLSMTDKLLASFFQVATPRTAGFNTLAYGDMGSPALLLTMFLMFIGGSPGSTAGGVKTVTLFVVMVIAWHLMRGSSTVVLFGRTLSLETAMKAAVLTIIAATVIGVTATMLFFLQPNIDSLALAFEVVSAFSTVGLSVGITADLDASSKLIIVLLMYVGRLGPLTLALALMQTQPKKVLEYPQENVLIG